MGRGQFAGFRPFFIAAWIVDLELTEEDLRSLNQYRQEPLPREVWAAELEQSAALREYLYRMRLVRRLRRYQELAAKW